MHPRYCANECQRATNVTLIFDLATDSSQGWWGMRHVAWSFASHDRQLAVSRIYIATTYGAEIGVRSFSPRGQRLFFSIHSTRRRSSTHASSSMMLQSKSAAAADHWSTSAAPCSTPRPAADTRRAGGRGRPRRCIRSRGTARAGLKIGDVGREPGKTLTDEFEFPIGRRTRRWRSRRRRAGRRHHFGWRR